MNVSPRDASTSKDVEVELRERIKELEFIHAAARLLNGRGERSDTLAAVLELLPAAWCHPELASARLVCGGLDLRTEHYAPSPWSLRCAFEVEGELPQQGFVEVVYRELPDPGRDAFLKEERTLLSSCAELIKSYLERTSAERVPLRTGAAEHAPPAVNIAKDEFLGVVAHELRSSLHVMRGWIDIMKQPASDRSLATRGLSILDRNVALQTKLIEDLLDLSRIGSGKLRLDLDWLDLKDLVAFAVDAARPAAEAKSLTLASDLEAVGEVCADQQRLQQVVYNLLGNAVKFTQNGGSVHVSLRRTGAHAELSIQDNGPGIQPELLPHIFEPFRQAGVPSGRSGGLGLGLAIARYMVEGQGGTIRAESEGTGKGATFRITLPLRAPQA